VPKRTDRIVAHFCTTQDRRKVENLSFVDSKRPLIDNERPDWQTRL